MFLVQKLYLKLTNSQFNPCFVNTSSVEWYRSAISSSTYANITAWLLNINSFPLYVLEHFQNQFMIYLSSIQKFSDKKNSSVNWNDGLFVVYDIQFYKAIKYLMSVFLFSRMQENYKIMQLLKGSVISKSIVMMWH